MRNLLKWFGILAIIGTGIAGWVTHPARLDPMEYAGMTGDAARGEAVFWAAGCASCHAAPGAEGDARLVLAGGRAFPSDFGTFYAPNISPDPVQGIGGWSLMDLANAMQRGVSPEGQHYYPAFPFASYVRATPQDVADLKAYLDGLPPSDSASRAHEVGFPFNIRRSLGGWKFLFFRAGPVLAEVSGPAERGRYLVEALGHCGECHTPRNMLGGLDISRWLAGAPDPSGKGRVPNITPAKLTWSERDLVEYFTSGFTPDYDSAGGHMAEVVQNLAKLPREDRAAIAAYLAEVPPVE